MCRVSEGSRNGVLGAIVAGLGLMACSVGIRAAEMPTIEANHEVLLGAYGSHYPQVVSFKGIPFAAPPIGDLRWREPLPHPARAGVQNAQSFAAGCYQDSYNTDWYRRVGAAFGVEPTKFADPMFSEDCLYLNVWTPQPAASARLPVMVWIYGGSNRAGWSYEPNYLGERLAARGNVVVVTVAYRVGIFGFFGHPELTGAQAPANFGLLDQIAGLRWVRDNIAQFGGDRDNITVFGESAGASDIGYLVNSPLAQNLFHRAISQSGGFQMQDHLRLADAEQTGTALSKAIPGTPGLAALRRLPSREVWEASMRGLPGHDFAPVVDGTSVIRSPAAAYAREGIPHDLLIGSNQDEWYMYVDGDPRGLATDLDAFAPSARKALEARAAQEPDVRTARDKVGTFVNMVCPAYLMAGAARAAGRSAWVYHFTRVRAGPGGATLGSYHGAEIPYVFDTHDAWLSRDSTDDALTTRMIDFWANFARYGNPNGSHGDAWPPFNPSSPRVMELGDRIGPLPAADDELCRRWAADLYPGWQESPPHAR
jgi:para-nitrobenzyl esterase